MREACPTNYNDIADGICYICGFINIDRKVAWNDHVLEIHRIKTLPGKYNPKECCIYKHYVIRQRVVR